MNLFNIKLRWMAVAYALFVTVALYGCGDTVSQSATGGGSNCNSHDGSCAITLAPPAEDEFGNALGTLSNPQNCPVQPPVHPTCSVNSQLECECVLP